MPDTIFALSSGSLPSGVAIVRLSGQQCGFVLETICDSSIIPGVVNRCNLIEPTTKKIIDDALVLRFVAPASYTGEDVAEFHVHGGKAVVNALLTTLADFDGLVMAQAGEFTWRAFENGKIDLTQAEAIGDLVTSETEAQRALAIGHATGNARDTYDGWAAELIQLRAYIEAEIDFVEEEDVPGSVSDQVWSRAQLLCTELRRHLELFTVAKLVQDGLRVALVGQPNSGKSSLLNYLAGQDIAIVTDVPGTTRDVLEVRIDLDGFPVVLFDTAGLRDGVDEVELEGIRRARRIAADADLILWLQDGTQKADLTLAPKFDALVYTKSDLQEFLPEDACVSVSSKTGKGIPELLDLIRNRIGSQKIDLNSIIVAKQRHRDCLDSAVEQIELSLRDSELPLEMRAEHLRLAAAELGKITGRSDVDDLLGTIFSSFCVGK